MTPKSFLALSGATLAAVAAAAVAAGLEGAQPALAERGERLFPDLPDRAEAIARIMVRDGDMQMEIERREGRFVDAVSGYPVDAATLRALVTSLGALEIAERKTADPARHADLDLAAWDAEDGAGAEIMLLDEDGDSVADLVAGARDFTLGGVSGGQFVRRGAEDQAWLVRGRVEAPTRRRAWFDTVLHDGETAEIVRMALTPESAEPIPFEREGEALALAVDPPAGRVADTDRPDRIARGLANLDFEDVRPDDGLAETGATLWAETAAGLRLHLARVAAPEETGDEDAIWARIRAEALKPEAEEAAAALAARTEGFVFRLSAWDAAPLGWTLEDITRPVDS